MGSLLVTCLGPAEELLACGLQGDSAGGVIAAHEGGDIEIFSDFNIFICNLDSFHGGNARLTAIEGSYFWGVEKINAFSFFEQSNQLVRFFFGEAGEELRSAGRTDGGE